MAGIISGFLDGAGRAAAEYGRMTLADQIRKEGEEADFLRNKEITKSKQSFTTSEREATQDFTAGENKKNRENRKSIASEKSKSGKGGSTNKIKEIRFLMTKEGGGLSGEEARLKVYPSSKIDYTDKEGNRVVVIPDGTGKNGKPQYKEVGRYKTDKSGAPVWLNAGEDLPNAEVIKAHRLEAQKTASDKASFIFTGDDFPSTGGDRKEWTKKEAQRLANEERAAKKSGGIVNSVANPSETKAPEVEKAEETKMIGKRKMTKKQYMDGMLKKHGQAKKSQIEKQWSEYSAGN